MTDFQYSGLADQNVETRLLTVLEGEFDDELRVRISYEALIKPTEQHQSRMCLEQLRKTPLSDWIACEMVKGRYLCFDGVNTPDITDRRCLFRRLQ